MVIIRLIGGEQEQRIKRLYNYAHRPAGEPDGGEFDYKGGGGGGGGGGARGSKKVARIVDKAQRVAHQQQGTKPAARQPSARSKARGERVSRALNKANGGHHEDLEQQIKDARAAVKSAKRRTTAKSTTPSQRKGK